MANETKRNGGVINLVLWVLQILGAGMFFMAGFAKLRGNDIMVQEFEIIGFGQWFRYFTGALEVMGGIFLLTPRMSPFGALILATVMIGAVIFHLALIGGSPMMALILLVAMSMIAWGRLRQSTIPVKADE